MTDDRVKKAEAYAIKGASTLVHTRTAAYLAGYDDCAKEYERFKKAAIEVIIKFTWRPNECFEWSIKRDEALKLIEERMRENE